ncbi:MAG: type 4a pilus biogenesis protein PilO [Actinomycetota bacterium]
MTRTRAWIAGAAFLAVVLMVASWFFLIAPQRSEASELRSQKATTENQNAQLADQIVELKKLQESLPAKEAQLEKVLLEIPEKPALPQVIRTLSANAKKTNVLLQTIEPSSPTPLVSAGASGAAAPASGGAGIQQIPVNATVTGTYVDLISFVEKTLAQGGRAFLVDKLDLAPYEGDLKPEEVAESENPTLQLTITGRVFTLNPNAVTPAPAGNAVPSTTQAN